MSINVCKNKGRFCKGMKEEKWDSFTKPSLPRYSIIMFISLFIQVMDLS